MRVISEKFKVIKPECCVENVSIAKLIIGFGSFNGLFDSIFN
jgi:hypothetical protein